MKPVMITFYVYAECDAEGERLQKELYNFVNDKYEQGVLIKADKVSKALSKFKDNILVNKFLND